MSDRVQLVFFEGCPNAVEARHRIESALTQLGLPKAWKEWDTMQPGTPEQYARFGSPTVLVDGTDVTGAGQGAGVGCAVGGAPAVDTIIRALQARSA